MHRCPLSDYAACSWHTSAIWAAVSLAGETSVVAPAEHTINRDRWEKAPGSGSHLACQHPVVGAVQAENELRPVLINAEASRRDAAECQVAHGGGSNVAPVHSNRLLSVGVQVSVLTICSL